MKRMRCCCRYCTANAGGSVRALLPVALMHSCTGVTVSNKLSSGVVMQKNLILLCSYDGSSATCCPLGKTCSSQLPAHLSSKAHNFSAYASADTNDASTANTIVPGSLALVAVVDAGADCSVGEVAGNAGADVAVKPGWHH